MGARKYAAAGMILDGNGTGSGVLIDPWWVMTAAHCIGSTPDYIKYFRVGGQSFAWNPDERYMNADEDIGVFKLSEPVYFVEPAKCWNVEMGSELGNVETIVGYGRTGTGLTGAVRPSRTRRAVCNMIDRVSSGGTRLYSDFDSPDPTNNSSGSAIPLPLEGMGASGDSGAPVFITDTDEQTYVAALHLGHWWSDGDGDCDYGDGNVWLRVKLYNDWIDSIITPIPGDANGDRKVDGSDVTILANNWQYGIGSTAAATVPEPGGVMLIIAGLFGLLVVRRRK